MIAGLYVVIAHKRIKVEPHIYHLCYQFFGCIQNQTYRLCEVAMYFKT